MECLKFCKIEIKLQLCTALLCEVIFFRKVHTIYINEEQIRKSYIINTRSMLVAPPLL